MTFQVDSRAESFLNWMGVKWSFEQIDFEHLSQNWRVSNMGRKEAVSEDAVQEYALMMEQGSAAPAVIIIHVPKDGYGVLDGVQRLHAADLRGSTTFSAYVVSTRTSAKTQRMIRVCANSRINGSNTPPKEFLLALAVTCLYFEDKCTAEEIASCIARNVADVRREIRFQKTTKLMQSAGFTGKLNKHHIASIGEFADESDWQQSPSALREFCLALERCGFKNGHADDLIETFFDIKRTKGKTRPTQFQSKLATFKKDPEVKQRLSRGTKRQAIDSLLISLRALNTILKKVEGEGSHIHDQDYALAVAREVQQMYSALRRITPHEVLYGGNGRSSIFDKG